MIGDLLWHQRHGVHVARSAEVLHLGPLLLVTIEHQDLRGIALTLFILRTFSTCKYYVINIYVRYVTYDEDICKLLLTGDYEATLGQAHAPEVGSAPAGGQVRHTLPGDAPLLLQGLGRGQEPVIAGLPSCDDVNLQQEGRYLTMPGPRLRWRRWSW